MRVSPAPGARAQLAAHIVSHTVHGRQASDGRVGLPLE
jgi:hypothetical protein